MEKGGLCQLDLHHVHDDDFTSSGLGLLFFKLLMSAHQWRSVLAWLFTLLFLHHPGHLFSLHPLFM